MRTPPTPKPSAGYYVSGPPGQRGYASPIGGVSQPYRTNMQIYEEKKVRAQTPRDIPLPPAGNPRAKGGE